MDREVFQKQFGLLGESEAMRQVSLKIMQVARTDITVLLLGESGVGKDVTARAIHGVSNRKQKNLVIVNCGAIPEGIIESELFGHEKGAFTGAGESREGYFEKANGGTIFLDEIGDTPKNVQVKLLRILESGEFFRVGSSQLRKTDVRVVAATNKDLWQEVEKGNFREDLYYRLDTVTIKLPPLRERPEDVIPIFKTFVQEFAAKYDSVFQGFSDEAKELLSSYRWPGNIRELRNVAEQLVVLEKSQFIDKERLQKYLKGRQHMGSTDHLPVHIRREEQRKKNEEGFPGSELVYKALIEMRQEISEMKRMMTGMMYGAFGRNMRASQPALPPHIEPDIPDLDHEDYPLKPGTYSDPSIIGAPASGYGHGDLGLSKNPYQERRKPEPIHTEAEHDIDEDLLAFFGNNRVPSLEETEKFLIQKALEKHNGNRRKASENLGVSERTLYRKLDQYDIS